MAATIVRESLGAANVELHPGTYQQPPPDVTDREVIIVDFSYKRPVLLEMAAKARKILILDHHLSAERELTDLPDNVETHFDMTRSGAMITWNFYNVGTVAPDIVFHIQDRDLWKFEMPGTREVMAALFSHPYDFDLWARMLHASNLVVMRQEGKGILRKHDKDIAEFIKMAAHWMTIDGHEVPALNCPYMWGPDAASLMAVNQPFAAYYWDGPDGRNFGLRSEDIGLDVSLIAEKFGGGGHDHAAGYRVALGCAAEAFRMLSDD